VTEPQTASIQLVSLGDEAAACEGDFCEIPPHHEQHIMNRRVDSDQI
jgi:hypothetical protein